MNLLSAGDFPRPPALPTWLTPDADAGWRVLDGGDRLAGRQTARVPACLRLPALRQDCRPAAPVDRAVDPTPAE